MINGKYNIKKDGLSYWGEDGGNEQKCFLYKIKKKDN